MRSIMKTMTRNEEMEQLRLMSRFFCEMPDEELFNFLYENSETFRKDVKSLEIKNTGKPII